MSADDCFKSLECSDVSGGCAYCNATQKLAEVEPRIWSLVVAHDSDCPAQRIKKAQSN